MIIKYNPKLKELARQLRNNATKSEIRLWQKLKWKQMYDNVLIAIEDYILKFEEPGFTPPLIPLS